MEKRKTMAKGDHDRKELLSCQEIPPVMRCRFIMRGYRKLNQPWSFYLRSLLTLHNETLNVWTHLLGSLLILVETKLLHREFGEKFPMECDFATFYATCSAIMHLASTSTHLLHSRSCNVHMFVFFCDYAGISIAGLGVSLSIYCFCSLPSYAALMRPVFLPLSAANAFLMTYVFCYTFATRRRQYSFIVRARMLLPIMTYYLWTFGHFFHKLYLKIFDGEDSVNLQMHHMLHLLILLISFLLYLSRFPERFYPGQFDICGQSHQLFHCGVTISQWLVLRSIQTDMRNGSPLIYSGHSQPIPVQHMWITWIVLLIFNVISLAFMYRRYCRDDKSLVKDAKATQ